ncbi:MAG: hypothetical protein JRJ77_18535, partial [Deltaproteobacteria bacterium]|nr:hypothetical protein [Deltaproteobacteria bacterium]
MKKALILLTFFWMFILVLGFNLQAQEEDAESSIYKDINMKEWNNQIRLEKFDLILPQVMRENNIDMWIHVMRISNPDAFGAEDLGSTSISNPDAFGAEDLGSTSGVFIFTDRGGKRIERAVLGRRWGTSHRGWGEQSNLVEECGAYDIIYDPVRVQEPVGGPMSEYDYRFKGIREF